MIMRLLVLALVLLASGTPAMEVERAGLSAEERVKWVRAGVMGDSPSGIYIKWKFNDVYQSFSSDLLRQAGLPIHEILMTPMQVDAIRAEGPVDGWNRYLFDTLASPEEILLVRFTEPIERGGDSFVFELVPALTPEQKAFRAGGAASWLEVLPEGYGKGHVSGMVSRWGENLGGLEAKAYAGRESMRERKLITEEIYQFDRMLSVNDGLREILWCRSRFQPERKHGHHILHEKTGEDRDRLRPTYGWVSGEYIVTLGLPAEVADSVLQSYLKRYPPSWDADFRFEPTEQTLGWIDEALVLLRSGLQDPLPHLRPTFRVYDFDRGLRRLVQFMPDGDGGKLKRFYEEQVQTINEQWRQSPDSQEPKLADYQVAIQQVRQACIDRVLAARERVVQHGVVHSGPGRWRSYGDDPK